MKSQIIKHLDLLTESQLLNNLRIIKDMGYWIDAVQRTSEFIHGRARWVIVYHQESELSEDAAEATIRKFLAD